jgi:murein DD-endopeptidase MepM/ murein hydrolase activator NlpD
MLAKTNHRILIVTAVCLLTVAMALCLPFVLLRSEAAKKVTDADIAAMRDKIAANKDKIADTEKELKELGDDIEKYIEIKDALDQQIATLEDTIRDTETLIGKYETLIAEKEQLIDESRREIDDKYAEFLDSLRLSYENGQKNYLELFLSSESLLDFLSRADRLGSMLSYEKNKLSELEREVNDLNALRTTLARQREEYVALKVDQDEMRASLTAKQQKAEDNLETLLKNQAALDKVLDKAKDNETKFDQELKDLIQKQKDQEIADAKKKLLWPLPIDRKKISSPYGDRILYGKPDFHLGIDLPAPKGTEIYASKGGTVLKATYHSSYGYYVLIDHGGEISTLYAHCSKLLVSKGDKVTRGQVIAEVGNTGNSYGAHLHYEVRKDGKTTDPLDKKAAWLIVEDGDKLIDPLKNNWIIYS